MPIITWHAWHAKNISVPNTLANMCTFVLVRSSEQLIHLHFRTMTWAKISSHLEPPIPANGVLHWFLKKSAVMIQEWIGGGPHGKQVIEITSSFTSSRHHSPTRQTHASSDSTHMSRAHAKCNHFVQSSKITCCEFQIAVCFIFDFDW